MEKVISQKSIQICGKSEIDDLLGRVHISLDFTHILTPEIQSNLQNSKFSCFFSNLNKIIVYVKKIDSILKMILQIQGFDQKIKFRFDIDQRRIVPAQIQTFIEIPKFTIIIPVLRESIKKRQYAFCSVFDKVLFSADFINCPLFTKISCASCFQEISEFQSKTKLLKNDTESENSLINEAFCDHNPDGHTHIEKMCEKDSELLKIYHDNGLLLLKNGQNIQINNKKNLVFCKKCDNFIGVLEKSGRMCIFLDKIILGERKIAPLEIIRQILNEHVSLYGITKDLTIYFCFDSTKYKGINIKILDCMSEICQIKDTEINKYEKYWKIMHSEIFEINELTKEILEACKKGKFVSKETFEKLHEILFTNLSEKIDINKYISFIKFN